MTGTSALLNSNIILELQLQKTDGSLSSEPLLNSFTQLQFFLGGGGGGGGVWVFIFF